MLGVQSKLAKATYTLRHPPGVKLSSFRERTNSYSDSGCFVAAPRERIFSFFHLCHSLHVVLRHPPGAEEVAVGEKLRSQVSHGKLGEDDFCPACHAPSAHERSVRAAKKRWCVAP